MCWSSAEKRWKRIRGAEEIENLLMGIEYKDGVMIDPQSSNREDVAG